MKPSFSLVFGEGYPEVRILKDFKASDFVSADCKGVMGAFSVSADSREFSWLDGPVWRCRLAFGGLRMGHAERSGWGKVLTPIVLHRIPQSYINVKDFLDVSAQVGEMAFE
jgi:hypothetical protein